MASKRSFTWCGAARPGDIAERDLGVLADFAYLFNSIANASLENRAGEVAVVGRRDRDPQANIACPSRDDFA